MGNKMKKYSLTKEHAAQLKPWAEKWINNAMSTKAMDEEDKAKMRIAIKGMYESAGKTPPPENRIIFVQSPFVMRFAAGFAAAIWWRRRNPTIKINNAATRAATRAATYAATYDATRAATDAATDTATYDATYAATRAATDAATDAATRAATYDATRAATRAATDAATKKKWFNFDIKIALKLSTEFGVGKFGLDCAYNADRMRQGGNQWSAWDCFITFFKDVVKLPIDYSKYEYWEMGAIHGGPRIMHPDFCIISDRPEILLVDEQNRPHCDNGPFCKWRDGTALYSIHGVRVPQWVVENPELITPEEILSEPNAEVRRVMAERFGFRKFGQSLIDSGKAKLISEQSVWGEPVRYYHFNDGAATMGFIHVINGTVEPDGSKHEFILTVKADNDNAELAVFSTYPQLMERIKNMPDKWKILRKSVRT